MRADADRPRLHLEKGDGALASKERRNKHHRTWPFRGTKNNSCAFDRLFHQPARRSLMMRSSLLIGGLLASIALVPALAQSNSPANNQQPAATTAPTSSSQQSQGQLWRASKLKGLDVYNEQNEKLGDISEILLDKSGKVEGVVIGVGGFLGMGQHDIKVEMSKLKFVDEPVRTSSTSSSNTNNSTTGANTRANTSGSSTTTGNANDHKWYPDHAVLSGASKDQLKSMPQFKYD